MFLSVFPIPTTIVITTTLPTTISCLWIPVPVRETFACPDGSIMTGFHNSPGDPDAGSEAKCCHIEGFSIDHDSCVPKALTAGATKPCSEVTRTYTSFLGKTCSSMDTEANTCQSSAGVPNISPFTVSSFIRVLE